MRAGRRVDPAQPAMRLEERTSIRGRSIDLSGLALALFDAVDQTDVDPDAVLALAIRCEHHVAQITIGARNAVHRQAAIGGAR